MILGEKKESEVLQKQGTLYLKTSFTFSLKLHILWIRQECAPTKIGSLLFGRILSRIFPKHPGGGIFGIFYHKNDSGGQLASVLPRKLFRRINYLILCMGMGFDYSNTHS